MCEAVNGGRNTRAHSVDQMVTGPGQPGAISRLAQEGCWGVDLGSNATMDVTFSPKKSRVGGSSQLKERHHNVREVVVGGSNRETSQWISSHPRIKLLLGTCQVQRT